jgi:hypothetical protein
MSMLPSPAVHQIRVEPFDPPIVASVSAMLLDFLTQARDVRVPLARKNLLFETALTGDYIYHYPNAITSELTAQNQALPYDGTVIRCLECFK